MTRRIFAAALALALALAPSTAFAGRGTKVLSDKTGAANGAVDTGNLSTESCDTVLVLLVAATGASGATTSYAIDETSPASCPAAGCIAVGTVASVPTATPDKSLSLGYGSAAPPPRRLRISGTGANGGTLRIRVECGFSRA